MTDATTTPENRCYRHPDRESFVRCQRCGRTICGQCQTLAAVGVHCPECVREARQSSGGAPLTTRFARAVRPGSGRPVVTYAIIGLAVIGFILEIATGNNPLTGDANGPVGHALAYLPGDILYTPWTIITVNFVHANLLHIALNMYSVFVIGPPLERYLGRTRFAALFLISGIGAVVAVDFFAQSAVVGASGAIFGLLGALVVFARRMGLRTGQLYVVIVINLAAGYFIPGIAWQAHVGGLVVGVALGFLLLRTSGPRRRGLQIAGLAGVTFVLLLSLVLHALAA
jgi:membrane associated rhomboid family serine protease